ncbi:MAG: rhomboid family intramembrane serine protease [Armatimonadota bacterium]
MDLNNVLLWMVTLSSVMMLYYGIRFRRESSGWAGIAVFLLALTGVLYLYKPQVAGFVSGACWGVLVLVPSLASRSLQRMVLRQRYGAASRMATILRLFHPFDGWWELPLVYRALEFGHRGQFDDAAQILERFRSENSSRGRQAMFQLLRMRGEWEECLTWLREQLLHNGKFADTGMATLYLRTLGETGDLNTLVETFAKSKRTLDSAESIMTAQGYLFLFAFCGHREGVEKLFSTSLAQYPATIRQFWLATTSLAAGDTTALTSITEIASGDDATLRLAAERRLTHPLADPATTLTPENTAILAQLNERFAVEEQYRTQTTPSKRAYVTFTLVAVNLLIFLVEILQHGSTDPQVLYRLGALTPLAVYQGEWWRLIAATFLHYGWLHVTMNMLGLLILGQPVERSLGHLRFLIVYLAAGIGGMVLITLLSSHGLNDITLGASGSVMGMVGAWGAIALWGWGKEKVPLARRHLLAVLTLVALQAAFDTFTPQVSFTGHLSGAIIGFIVAWLLMPRRKMVNG